jgi:hypothetical protein
MNKNFIKSKQTIQQRTANTSPSKRLKPQPQRGLKPTKTTKNTKLQTAYKQPKLQAKKKKH